MNLLMTIQETEKFRLMMSGKQSLGLSHILLIDDDETLLDTLGDYLYDRGHQVTRCSNPLEAVEIIENTDVELALLDYEMPAIKGSELLARIRHGSRGSRLPVLFLSGLPALNYASQVPSDSRLCFLHKPVQLDDLDLAIAAMFRS